LSPAGFSPTDWFLAGVLLLGILCFGCARAASLSPADLSLSTCGLRSCDSDATLVDVLPAAEEPLKEPTIMEYYISFHEQIKLCKKTLGETQTLCAGRSNAEPKIFALPQTP